MALAAKKLEYRTVEITPAIGQIDIFQKTGQKCEFRLAPLDSKLYAINTHEEEIIPEPPKEYSIYGDFKQGV